jgi:GT2 family glycosyltransferase
VGGVRPEVSVVVSVYDDQQGLDRVLAGLGLQDLTADRFEVVVADDGSPVEPVLGERPYPVRLVRQGDDGFRLAAARNLGARGTRGRLLCFLDGDTVPAPGYLSATLRAADEVGDRALLVGRRRHVDLTGWSVPQVVAWLDGSGAAAPRELDDPAWLADAYRASDDLRRADDESYRYVIGAVLSLTRDLWDAVGGFDETFTGYGGEDWELAHRCRLAGAGLRHVRGAVAWHDGPDLAGREVDLAQVLTGQALALASRLPSPALRPDGVAFARPVCAVEVDDRGWPPHVTLLVVGSLLAGGPDARVWLADGTGLLDDGPLAGDARVARGPVPDEVSLRATWRVRVDRPVELQVPLDEVLAGGPGRLPGVRVERTRDLALGRERVAALPAAWARPVEPGELGAVLRRRRERGARRRARDGAA